MSQGRTRGVIGTRAHMDIEQSISSACAREFSRDPVLRNDSSPSRPRATFVRPAASFVSARQVPRVDKRKKKKKTRPYSQRLKCVGSRRNLFSRAKMYRCGGGFSDRPSSAGAHARTLSCRHNYRAGLARPSCSIYPIQRKKLKKRMME